MARTRTFLVAAAVAAAAVALAPSAGAQEDDYPGTSATTPDTCDVSASFNAPLLPNATVNVTLGCDLIEAGNTYTGNLASTPVALPNTEASADDTVTFVGVKLPSDWELDANHSATLVDLTAGRTLGSVSFFVGKDGRITAAPSGGGSDLPRTGSDFTTTGFQVGAALLAAGTLAVVTARRRRAHALVA